MKGNRIPAIMRKKRNPAMSDEEIKASTDAAASDFKEEVDEEKPTISYREIDPDEEKKFKAHIERVKAIQSRKARDKKAYDRFQRELTKQEKGW